MTENETKEVLNTIILATGFDAFNKPSGVPIPLTKEEIANACNTAIKALEEVQQYRAIGKVSTCRNAVEICRAMIERGIEPDNIMEYIKFEDYVVQKGFTIKGLLEAGEKQVPKKPIAHQCVACGNAVIPFEGKYCSNCGQKLDWSDEE